MSGGSAAHRSHKPENIIAFIVAVRVVEGFEMIDIDHGDHIFSRKGLQALIQGAAVGNLRQLVDVNPLPVHGKNSVQMYERRDGKRRQRMHSRQVVRCIVGHAYLRRAHKRNEGDQRRVDERLYFFVPRQDGDEAQNRNRNKRQLRDEQKFAQRK